MRLAGKTALVTGSTSGIGRAIATGLASEGARVVVSGRDAGRGAETVETIRAGGGRADFVAADLDGAESSYRLAEEATAALEGRVDVLVNSAGVFPPAPSLEANEAIFDHLVAVNVRAPYFLVQALVPGMVDRGGGAVVNIGSWVAQVGLPAGALYAASKSMVEGLTRGWAAEFGPANVRVNAIAPGVTRTEGTAESVDALAGLVSTFPARRLGVPEDIAHAAVYLASEEAAFVHGMTMLVDGGAMSTRG